MLILTYMKKVRNTPQRGRFRHIVFKDGDTWYAVALEFNIVESSDDPKLALFSMYQAVAGYINSIRKIKGLRSYEVLNQKTDPEYEKLWGILNPSNSVAIKSPYPIDTFGYSAV